MNQPCLFSGPTPAVVGGCPPRSCVRSQHRHTPVNPRFSGASRRSGQSYGLVHPPLQSVSTRRGTMRWELINHFSSRRTKARPAVNGANAIMNATFNSWPSETYLPAGVPECPQQCSAWYLRNKHPSQTCSCVPDRASPVLSGLPMILYFLLESAYVALCGALKRSAGDFGFEWFVRFVHMVSVYNHRL